MSQRGARDAAERDDIMCSVMPDEVVISVDTWPPAKSDAKSMLAAGHTHAKRVHALLAAVYAEIEPLQVPVFGPDAVGLELLLRSPAEPQSDATNFLGGVADVLEVKDQRGALEHLGRLAVVALYENDRQIHEGRYRWSISPDVGYVVRVWRL